MNKFWLKSKTASRSLSLTFINNFITYTLTSFSLNWRDINRSWRLPGKLYCIHNSSVLISASCQDGYAAYIAPEFQVCLKFVPVSSVHTKAKEHCEAEGGDLIRIDSTLKYDIFKQMLGKKKSLDIIAAWIWLLKRYIYSCCLGSDWLNVTFIHTVLRNT